LTVICDFLLLIFLQTVIIREGGAVYEYWHDPPTPIYLKVYMFNISNKDEFLQGQKAALNEVGPYIYK